MGGFYSGHTQLRQKGGKETRQLNFPDLSNSCIFLLRSVSVSPINLVERDGNVDPIKSERIDLIEVKTSVHRRLVIQRRFPWHVWPRVTVAPETKLTLMTLHTGDLLPGPEGNLKTTAMISSTASQLHSELQLWLQTNVFKNHSLCRFEQISPFVSHKSKFLNLISTCVYSILVYGCQDTTFLFICFFCSISEPVT